MNRNTPLMRLLRFAIVGASVAGIYWLLFLGLRQLALPRMAASSLAFIISVTVQYLLQTIWTFQQPAKNRRHMLRFATMVTAGMGIAALITGYLGPRLGWSDALAAAVVVVTLPLFNFAILSLWVYEKPKAKD